MVHRALAFGTAHARHCHGANGMQRSALLLESHRVLNQGAPKVSWEACSAAAKRRLREEGSKAAGGNGMSSGKGEHRDARGSKRVPVRAQDALSAMGGRGVKERVETSSSTEPNDAYNSRHHPHRLRFSSGPPSYRNRFALTVLNLYQPSPKCTCVPPILR